MSSSLSLLALLAAAPAPGPAPQEPSMSIRALLDRGHPRAPDLDRVGTWLGTDRPLLLRGALKGRVVLLDFWTSGCVNCLHALPVYRALEERFRGQQFQVLGIHSGKFDAEKEVSAVAEAMARVGIDHPVGTDSDLVVWDQYAIHGWPTSVLVDARGYAVAWFRGEPELAVLTAWVQAALDDGRARGVLASGPAEFRRPAVGDTGPLAFPGKVLALSTGGLAVADSGHHRLLLLDGSGMLVRTIGSGLEGFSDGAADIASFRSPQGLAERSGALYVADTGNHAVRRVDLGTGRVETLAGNGRKAEGAIQPAADARTVALRTPWDLTFLGDTLWIAMAGSHQLWRLDVRSGALSAGAGSGREGLDDGSLAEATFAQPSALATDGHVLYVADSEASAIRRVESRRGHGEDARRGGAVRVRAPRRPARSGALPAPSGPCLRRGSALGVGHLQRRRPASVARRWTGEHRRARPGAARRTHPRRGAAGGGRHGPSPAGDGDAGDRRARSRPARRCHAALGPGGGASGAGHAGVAGPAPRGCAGGIGTRRAPSRGASTRGPHLHRRRAPAAGADGGRPRRAATARVRRRDPPRHGGDFPSENAVGRGVLGVAVLLPGRTGRRLPRGPPPPAHPPGPHGGRSRGRDRALPTHTAGTWFLRGGPGDKVPPSRRFEVKTKGTPPMPNPTDTFLSGSNIDFIEGLYARWLEDPSSVDPSWGELFAGTRTDGRPLLGSGDGRAQPTNGHGAGNGSAVAIRAVNGGNGAAVASVPARGQLVSVGDMPAALAAMQLQSRVDQTVYAFRLRGHLLAQLDPLGRPRPPLDHVADLAHGRATRHFTPEELEQVVDSSRRLPRPQAGEAARAAGPPAPHLLRAPSAWSS